MRMITLYAFRKSASLFNGCPRTSHNDVLFSPLCVCVGGGGLCGGAFCVCVCVCVLLLLLFWSVM